VLEERTLIDILLVSEVAWCILFIGHRTLERALFYAGALVSSGYVASISSDWVTNVLFGHAASAMSWITAQVKVPAEPVGLIGAILPPESTLGGHTIDTHWIAFHVTSALLATLITISIFTLFIVLSQLGLALWDTPESHTKGVKQYLSYICSLVCGVYVAFLTGDAFANLSWLRMFSPISGQVAHSVLLGIASSGFSFARLYIL
jgi:hypothetical protein